MTPTVIFNVQLVLGYAAWLLCFMGYLWPRLRTMGVADASRAIAALHSFRFFGLVFIFPGLLGPGVPSSFAVPAAWGDSSRRRFGDARPHVLQGAIVVLVLRGRLQCGRSPGIS